LYINISLGVKSENGLCLLVLQKIYSEFDKEIQFSKTIHAIQSSYRGREGAILYSHLLHLLGLNLIDKFLYSKALHIYEV